MEIQNPTRHFSSTSLWIWSHEKMSDQALLQTITIDEVITPNPHE